MVNFECPACYCSTAEKYVFLHMHGGSSKWHGMVMCFKPQAVNEFPVAQEESVTNIHK